LKYQKPSSKDVDLNLFVGYRSEGMAHCRVTVEGDDAEAVEQILDQWFSEFSLRHANNMHVREEPRVETHTCFDTKRTRCLGYTRFSIKEDA
jgi:hypothetical protein